MGRTGIGSSVRERAASLDLLDRARASPLIRWAVLAYLATWALPISWPWDLPLALLVVATLAAGWVQWRDSSGSAASSTLPPLAIPVLLFLVLRFVTAASSADPGRSLGLSAAMLPAVLLFFLVAGHFRAPAHTPVLYFAVALVSLAVASLVTLTVWLRGGSDLDAVIRHANIPLLVVKNDVVFLSVTAPFALALVARRARQRDVVVGLAALGMSVIAIGAVQSRGALATLAVALLCTAYLVAPRLAAVTAVGVLLAVLVTDSALGFPLARKFASDLQGSGRLPLWLAAWALFLEAPLLGHGPASYLSTYGAQQRQLVLPAWMGFDERISPWPHNLYLEVAAEQGLVGLAGLAVLGAAGAWTLLRLRRRAGVRRALVAAVSGSFVGLWFAAAFELTLIRAWVVLILFVIYGIISSLAGHGGAADERL